MLLKILLSVLVKLSSPTFTHTTTFIKHPNRRMILSMMKTKNPLAKVVPKHCKYFSKDFSLMVLIIWYVLFKLIMMKIRAKNINVDTNLTYIGGNLISKSLRRHPNENKSKSSLGDEDIEKFNISSDTLSNLNGIVLKTLKSER